MKCPNPVHEKEDYQGYCCTCGGSCIINPQPKTSPMTDEEIEETKTTLEIMVHRPSINNRDKDYIKKSLELIIMFQVENSLLRKQVKFYIDKEIIK